VPKPKEKKVLHHYQHQREDGVTYTIDVFKILEDDAVSYEIQSGSMRQRPTTTLGSLTLGHYESDSFSDHYTDPEAVNAKFLEMIGMHFK
jgi:hypothetical protein